MINASVLNLKENNTLSNCRPYLNSLMTDMLIIFDDLGICLLGYRIEFSCLYNPQGHNFISTLWH